MKLSHTHVRADIDLESPGKHAGHLRIPHSVHRSAYGWLPMPIVSVRNGDGPQVLLLGGNHGDEYEGQVALARLARRLDPAHVRGHIVILPMANHPAAMAGTRTSPVDSGNLNRSFPGDRDGSVTERIAHLIEADLVAGADLVIDLHSGGSSLEYLPSSQSALDAAGGVPEGDLELIAAFGAPFHQFFPLADDDGQCGGAAARKGAAFLTTELGGAGTVGPGALAVAERGLERVLRHAGSVVAATGSAGEPGDGDPADVDGADVHTRFQLTSGPSQYVYALDDGIYVPLVELGDQVRPGDPAAEVHFPESPLREPALARFEDGGMVVCKRVPGRCVRGDCLFHLAADWSPPRAGSAGQG